MNTHHDQQSNQATDFMENFLPYGTNARIFRLQLQAPRLTVGTMYFSSIGYSLKEINESDGIVEPFFPKYRQFVFSNGAFIALLVDAPWQVINIECVGCKPNKYIDPPPPPKDKDCDCMDCCPDVSNLEAMLKLIIKRIGEPEKVTIFDENLERKGTQKADKTPESLNEYF